MEWPYSIAEASVWYTYSLFHPEIADKIPKLLLNQWKGYYLKVADKFMALTHQQPYRMSWPLNQDFWMAWGNTTMTNHARALLIAYQLTHQKKYWDVALQNIGYMLGANPLGMSWTTGLGYTYPIEIQHAISEDDKIMDPIPGISIYGTVGYYPDHFKRVLWKGKTSEGKELSFMKTANQNLPVWRMFAAHPHQNVPQNEFTIHQTISPSIFSFAFFLPEGWMPSEDLMQQQPREDKFLFGFWILP